MRKVFDAYAAYYDLLYKDKDYISEAAFVHDLLMKNGMYKGDILDLGCGTGKHAEQFAQMGYRVHGVDMSHTMIEAGQQRTCGGFGEQLSFEQGDLRTYRTERKFDAVISLFHVASYQILNKDIAAMFATAFKHLKPGGIFIFDFWYGPAVLTDRPETRVKKLASENVEVVRIAEPVMHPNDNVVDVNYTVHVTERASGKVITFDENHRMRYFFSPELKHWLEISGFRVKAIMEWMTEKPLSFDTWFGIVMAEREIL